MPDQAMIDLLNEHSPPCVKTLGGRTIALDAERQCVMMGFDISLDCCHSGNVVQGGFVTGMLDAAMAHAVFGSLGYFTPLPSLEIKVSFIAPALAGQFKAEGRVVRLGKSIAFLEASLLDPDDNLIATATSTAKIIRPKDSGPA